MNSGVIKIPYEKLSSEALHGLIEEFVTRDGTDYGQIEIPIETKINQVKRQIESGKAIILYDEAIESCNIFLNNDPRLKNLEF